MKSKSTLAVVSASALVLVSTVVVSSPANAAIGDCNTANRACGWVENNYVGYPGKWSGDTSNLGGYNNRISSAYNRTATTIAWFPDPGYAGGWSFVQGAGAAGYFNWPDYRNDAFDSVAFY